MAAPKIDSDDTTAPIIAYKAFAPGWICRGYQYALGETYEHEGPVKACNSGFHACTDIRDLPTYYPPTGPMAVVEMSGDFSTGSDDSKVAARRITIKAELKLPDYVDLFVKAAFAAAKWVRGSSATGDWGAASATGDRGAASATGTRGAASATGDSGAASATGYSGAASATGTRGAASATGYKGAASATGYKGAASATGARGAASATGTSGAASALHPTAIALGAGYKATAQGVIGAALALVERDAKGSILAVWAGIVDGQKIREMTPYRLIDGHPVEAE